MKKQTNLLRYFAGLAVFLVVAPFALYLFYFNDGFARDAGDWASFGEYYGGTAGALLAAAAFGGLLYTIHIQVRELSLSREALMQSATALARQSKTLTKQNFESSLFEIVHLHMELRAQINVVDTKGNRQTGASAFRALFDAFKLHYEDIRQSDRAKGITIDLERLHKQVDEAYERLYEGYRGDVGHYFRSLYTIIRFIHEKGPSSLEGDADAFGKKDYIRIVRSQLSSFEEVMLLYNCLSPYGIKYFKPLVERYELLDNLNLDLLPDKQATQLYEESAFKTLLGK